MSTLSPQVKAALQELLMSCAGGVSDMAHKELAELDRILQPEIERLLLDALYDLRARKQVLPVHGGNDSLQPSRYVEVVMVSALDLLISKHESALTQPKHEEQNHE